MPSFLSYFIHKDTRSGVLLLLATAWALTLANSSWQNYYSALLNFPLQAHSLVYWINDGLMAIFFFQVGLELKRERCTGHLRAIQQIILPSVAALGGVILPILIYFIVTLEHPEYHAGWAIPMATDIAFALTVITLLSKHISSSMKTFLLTLAIMDDLLAIFVIALFHTQQFSYFALIAMFIIIALLFLLNKIRYYFLPIYIILSIALWFATLHSGIHPTIAGVIAAFMIPLYGKQQKPILTKLESTLTPWVTLVILPIFAFANAGITFSTLTLHSFLEPVVLGILLGLAIGKPVGIILFSQIYARLAKFNHNFSIQSLAILGSVAGIGFTMSLFLSDLSFQDPSIINLCRLGILSGSLLSVFIALFVYFKLPTRKSTS